VLRNRGRDANEVYVDLVPVVVIGRSAETTTLDEAPHPLVVKILVVIFARIQLTDALFVQVDAECVKSLVGVLDSKRKSHVAEPNDSDGRLGRLQTIPKPIGRRLMVRFGHS
jgi:hypothetical protein